MEYRFDRIEDRLDDLEQTIKEEHFWTRLTPRMEDLNSVKQRVEDYFAVSDPKARAARERALDDKQYDKAYDGIYALRDTFEGANGRAPLCDQVKEFSEIDRRTVLNVGVDLYNRMIRGALDLVLIANILGKDDQHVTQGDMAELLERIGNVIETCDTEIATTEWKEEGENGKRRWISEMEEILGDTPKGEILIMSYDFVLNVKSELMHSDDKCNWAK